MSSGYYLTSAFYYFNLGAHMMYILKNRLDAQNVKKQKIIKILEDISNAIFKQHFIQGLLVPQDPFTVLTLKDVFSRLAHSSVMKLDQSSMQKMFYLMLMSVKKQIFLTSSPLQLYTLTLSHLLNISKFLQSQDAVNNIQYALNNFQKTASRYSFIQYMQVRQYMLSQLERNQTKIVNFIQAGLQGQAGKLIFKIRNSHNQKSIGSSVNQTDLDINLVFNQAKNQLFYNDWQNWKTSLVIDFVEDYKKASQSRKNKKQTNQQSKTIGEKSLGDILNLNLNDVQNFQVKFDMFQEEIGKGQMKQFEVENSQKSMKIAGSSNSNVKASNNFKNKIDKQFSDLKLQQNQDQQPDLLSMMDS